MPQPTTLRPTTVNAMPPTRAHSLGVRPSRIFTSLARGLAMGRRSSSVGNPADTLENYATRSQQRLVRHRATGVGWGCDQEFCPCRAGGGRRRLGRGRPGAAPGAGRTGHQLPGPAAAGPVRLPRAPHRRGARRRGPGRGARGAHLDDLPEPRRSRAPGRRRPRPSRARPRHLPSGRRRPRPLRVRGVRRHDRGTRRDLRRACPERPRPASTSTSTPTTSPCSVAARTVDCR